MKLLLAPAVGINLFSRVYNLPKPAENTEH